MLTSYVTRHSTAAGVNHHSEFGTLQLRRIIWLREHFEDDRDNPISDHVEDLSSFVRKVYDSALPEGFDWISVVDPDYNLLAVVLVGHSDLSAESQAVMCCRQLVPVETLSVGRSFAVVTITLPIPACQSFLRFRACSCGGGNPGLLSAADQQEENGDSQNTTLHWEPVYQLRLTERKLLF